MKRIYSDGRIPTLEVALTENMNADDVKKLAKHTNQKIPTRKADIAAVVKQYLDRERLKAVWQGLDELQRAAVAEVVHSSSTHFLADRIARRHRSLAAVQQPPALAQTLSHSIASRVRTCPSAYLDTNILLVAAVR